MKKTLIALIVVSVACLACAQRDHHSSSSHSFSHSSSHSGSFARPESHTMASRPSGGSFGSHSYQRASGHSFASHSGYGEHAAASGSFTRHGGFGGAVHSGNFANTHFDRSNFSRRITDRTWFRPSGHSYARGWFAGHGYRPGPVWVAPVFSCYVGYSWAYQPSVYNVVWLPDPVTGQYYEAYYYPQYGYYAWASRPLVAIGIYRPGVAFSVRL